MGVTTMSELLTPSEEQALTKTILKRVREHLGEKGCKIVLVPLLGNPELQKENDHWKPEIRTSDGELLLRSRYTKGRFEALMALDEALMALHEFLE